MQTIVSSVRNQGCALTFADAIQVAGAAAVARAGGPTCAMLMGRPDRGAADAATGRLPSNCDSAQAQVDRFGAQMGFRNPVAAVAVLSGAHNLGASRATPQSTCSRGLGALTAQPNTFDGHCECRAGCLSV
jgi:hypothetical protein